MYIQYCFIYPEYTLNAFKLFNTSLLMNFGGILKEILPRTRQNFHKPVFPVELQTKLKQRRTGQCPKHSEEYIVRKRAKNSKFPCEFG